MGKGLTYYDRGLESIFAKHMQGIIAAVRSKTQGILCGVILRSLSGIVGRSVGRRVAVSAVYIAIFNASIIVLFFLDNFFFVNSVFLY